MAVLLIVYITSHDPPENFSRDMRPTFMSNYLKATYMHLVYMQTVLG